jgi:hypothetical protein
MGLGKWPGFVDRNATNETGPLPKAHAELMRRFAEA